MRRLAKRIVAGFAAACVAALSAFPFACLHRPPTPPRRPAHAQALRATVYIDTPSKVGSGIAWDSRTIVTAKHVVWPPAYPTITTHAGDVCEALSTTYSFDYDIAVIRVHGCKLEPLEHAQPHVGASVWAAGHPMNHKWAVTHGVVMALREDDTLFETDTAINPGMSGGPVVNEAGELVGMSVAIVTRDGMYAGLGLAISLNELARTVSES